MSVLGFRVALASVLVSAVAGFPLGSLSAEPAPAPAQDNAAANGKPAGIKLLVLPYQPILRSVPQKKVKQATDFLTKELGNTDGLDVLKGGVATSQSSGASLGAAEANRKQAVEAEAGKDIVKAVDLWKKTIAELEKNASAMTTFEPYIEAHHRLARAQMWLGNDKAAKATMDVAARMSPNFPLKPTEYSRQYRRWFLGIAKNVVRERTGDLLVKSAVPGTEVQLDGRKMEVAPVLIRKILPGKHMIAARVEGVPPFGAVVTIKAKNKTEFSVNFAGILGGAEVGDVTDAVAANGLPKKAVQKAVAAGKNAGAKFVVVGGMSRDRVGNDLNVHTFVVKVDGGQVKTLNPVDFDSEMLTAESDVIRVVRQVEAAVKDFGGAGTMVAQIEKRTAGFAETTINEASGAPPRPTDRPTARTQAKRERKVFKALEGGSIRIKDEEE